MANEEACGFCGYIYEEGDVVYPHEVRHCDDCLERCAECRDEAGDGDEDA